MDDRGPPILSYRSAVPRRRRPRPRRPARDHRDVADGFMSACVAVPLVAGAVASQGGVAIMLGGSGSAALAGVGVVRGVGLGLSLALLGASVAVLRLVAG